MSLAETLDETAPIPISCPRQILVQHLAPWGTSALQHKENSRIQKSLSKSSYPSKLPNLQVIIKSSIIKQLQIFKTSTATSYRGIPACTEIYPPHRSLLEFHQSFRKKNFQNARTIYAYRIFFSKSC